jgi:putative DNA primase/helicase
VKVVDLPELPEKGDLTDWLDAGHTAEEFFSVVEAAPIYGNDNNDNDFEDLNELPEPCGFPLSALPPSVRQFVRDGAASIGCPRDFVGVSVLAALSAAIGDTRRLVIKKDWLEGPCLYTMIIGPPASKKSPAMKLALRPVRDKQMKLKASHEIAKAAYKAEEIDTKPVLRRSYVDDVTVERLADIFNENPRGVLVAKDELAGWLGSMNQYKAGGRGGDRQKWLSIHTNEAIAVDRKSTDEPCIVPRPFASIVGGIQPRVLPDFGNDRGDGLIDRFLPAYPDPVVSEWSDAEVSDDAWTAYTETINRLYNLNHVEYEDDLFPSKVHMTEDAKALFIVTYNMLLQESASPGFPQRLQDAWGKPAGHLGRLALILAMTRIAELDRQGVRVTEEVEGSDMKGAIELLWYFKNHLRRMFTGLYGSNPLDRLAADLRDFLIDNGGTWEGIASELHEALNSEYKPEREKELGKLIRSIAKRSSLLHIEDLQRTRDRRPFRIILRDIAR